MKVVGVTNQIGTKDLGLFFWDYDKVQLDDVIDDARTLSKIFGIDIYILESSSNSYHLLSFDILSHKQISTIQGYTTLESDYLNIDEIETNFFNILRLGEKGKKPSPKFIKVFYAENNQHLKSLGHYKYYKVYCNVPIIPKKLESFFIRTTVDLIMYNSHKVEKKVVRNKWI